jgi:hypothetical protein
MIRGARQGAGWERNRHLLAAEDQALLDWRYALLLLDLLLYLRHLRSPAKRRGDRSARPLREEEKGWEAAVGDEPASAALGGRQVSIPCSRFQCRARSPCPSGSVLCLCHRTLVSLLPARWRSRMAVCTDLMSMLRSLGGVCRGKSCRHEGWAGLGGGATRSRATRGLENGVVVLWPVWRWLGRSWDVKGAPMREDYHRIMLAACSVF